MTEGELCEWLGVSPVGMTAKKARLRREIVEGMKDVPFPAPRADKAQLFAFSKFLECAGGMGGSVVEPLPETAE